MGSLSGHRIFSDVISSQEKNIDGSSYEFFNEGEFVKKIIQRMRESHFI